MAPQYYSQGDKRVQIEGERERQGLGPSDGSLGGQKKIFSNVDKTSNLQDLESKKVDTDNSSGAGEHQRKSKSKQRRVQFEDLYDSKSILEI